MVLLAGCGARSGLENPPGDGGCALPVYARDAAFQQRACGTTCTLVGSDEHGASVRFHCDGRQCQFFVNGIPGCTCTELDWANVCSNGVPLCVRRSNFDFTRVESLPCTDD